MLSRPMPLTFESKRRLQEFTGAAWPPNAVLNESEAPNGLAVTRLPGVKYCLSLFRYRTESMMGDFAH